MREFHKRPHDFFYRVADYARASVSDKLFPQRKGRCLSKNRPSENSSLFAFFVACRIENEDTFERTRVSGFIESGHGLERENSIGSSGKLGGITATA